MVTLADGDFAQVSPTFYSFPATAIGNSSTDHALTFTNTGSASLHIIGAQVPGQFPITSNNCPSDLGVGASCVFNVNFMPADAGDQAGTLTVFTARSEEHTSELQSLMRISYDF